MCCEACHYCQIRFVKSIQDNTYRCKLMKCKPIEIPSVLEGVPDWCPLK